MSPINGLSEQRRLPRLGKIHLGIKKTSEKTGKEYPTATDYFVIPDEWQQYLPEKPTELSIMIPVEDDELWCNQYYKCYSRTRGLTCRGDGATCRRMVDVETGEKAGKDTKDVLWREGLVCEGRECPYYQAKECKETMNLQFIMPDLPGLGVWQIDTSSINSIRNINSDAAMIRAVYKRIAFIPLLLTLEPQEVVNPDDGKKKTVRCMHLRTNGTMRQLMIEAAKPITELLLPPPPVEDGPAMDSNGEEDKPRMTAEELKAGLKDVYPEEQPAPARPATPAPVPESSDAKQEWDKLGKQGDAANKVTPSIIDKLMVYAKATDEADLKVKAEAFLGKPLKSLLDMLQADAERWASMLLKAKK